MKKILLSCCILALVAGMAQAQAADAVANVAVCKAFVSRWSGDWPYVGRMWLDVMKVGSDCSAQYSYQSDSGVPTRSSTAQIVGDTLAFPCNRGKGTCSFTLHGDRLWANYKGEPGPNHTVFDKN